MRRIIRYRTRRSRLRTAGLVLLLLGLALLAILRPGLPLPAVRRILEQHQPGLYGVSRFVDGDTIAVEMNGQTEKVRLVGVDTPETHKPNTPVQCYGPAAAAFTRATIGTQQVRLASDPLSTDRDRYGRLLRYVYLPDGTLLNERLIQGGYGFYYPYFPFTKAKQFATDEQVAMTAHKGLWGSCHPTPTDSGGYVSNNQS